MRGWDTGERGDAPEPSEESMARVRAGRNPRYDTTPRRFDHATPEEVIDALRLFVRGIVDEALEARR